jgi:hypothetical protein
MTSNFRTVKRRLRQLEIRTPEKKESDLIFAVYQNSKTPFPTSLYVDLRNSFGKTLDRMNKVIEKKEVMEGVDK